MPPRDWIVPGLLWLWLGWNLHYEWTLNPQYHFGWAVPLLALFLFWQRWQDRPRALPLRNDRRARAMRAGVLFLLLPVRLIEEANPDWRLLSWVLALLVVCYMVATLAEAGGWAWARHLAFPVCFMLVAVPWPMQLEIRIVQTLTRAVAAVAVEIAGWMGLGAYQLGNVIQLRNGFVGVDEACSGVRTLQTAIMATVFLGELLRLPVRRRILLVLAGCGWVFACNVARAAALVIIAGNRGIAALERWHDFIGTAVLILGMAGILAAAWLLARSSASKLPERPAAPFQPLEKLSWSGVGASVAWLILVFAATEFWYRGHERMLAEHPAWTVRWPGEHGVIAIPEATRAMLRYSDAASATWSDDTRATWWGFFARWAPGRTALQLVRSHSPEVCLPAIGRTFVRELSPVTLGSGPVELHFRVYEFAQQGQPLFIFVAVQEDKFFAGETGSAQDWNARGGLRAVLRGQRNLGQRLLELAVAGAADFPRARAAADKTVRLIVQPAPATG